MKALSLCIYLSYVCLPASVSSLYQETKSSSSPPYSSFESMVAAVIEVESGGDPLAVSPVGAEGLMQLMTPAIVDASTFCNLPLTLNTFDPESNILLGSCYLHLLYQQTGSWEETLIIYNGGYRALARHRKGLPIPRETRNYLLKIRRVCE